MQLTNTLFGFAAIAAATVNAQAGKTIKVTVGNGALAYSPNNIGAEIGTQIEFSFFPKNHTVTQSSFADPCHPLAAGGFFSGFVPTKADEAGISTFTITVTDKKPIWFYCSQTVGNHCQSGMVGAINAPTSGNTLDAFTALAKNASKSTFPSGGPAGGILKLGDSNSTSSSSASGSVTASSGNVAATSSSSLIAFTGAASTMKTFNVGAAILAAAAFLY